jgi:ABC-type protease/lipase transport system fused ATPase/permease subunit
VAYRISADSNGIVEAYKAASIYNRIVDCDGGYNAIVREGGVKLLGGKR